MRDLNLFSMWWNERRPGNEEVIVTWRKRSCCLIGCVGSLTWALFLFLARARCVSPSLLECTGQLQRNLEGVWHHVQKSLFVFIIYHLLRLPFASKTAQSQDLVGLPVFCLFMWTLTDSMMWRSGLCGETICCRISCFSHCWCSVSGCKFRITVIYCTCWFIYIRMKSGSNKFLIYNFSIFIPLLIVAVEIQNIQESGEKNICHKGLGVRDLNCRCSCYTARTLTIKQPRTPEGWNCAHVLHAYCYYGNTSFT